ncbi:DoxX family membrane protein [Chitinophaga vietnamensis]|uniref:DoxX family membrane protein n=1 Tax=Chitinophaga vietnamensis TaxID=2593957 RepID=UPI00117865B4|nr:DoxX family membrane protein [Chitinophaga vietnamensis]
MNTTTSKSTAIAQLYLRLALGIDFLVIGLDRVGAWGPYGAKYVSWGDWEHYFAYAKTLMFFLPLPLAKLLAATATVCEIVFGALLVTGFLTRWAAIGSGILTLCFALCMAAANGITSPIGYSVFVVSSSSFLLATLPYHKWSIDTFLKNR